jgi:saccharopine dehydrogenase-like NADP-dependent oxidoreductase
METHIIHSELLRRRVRVLVVGCGGTGSAIVWNPRHRDGDFEMIVMGVTKLS